MQQKQSEKKNGEDDEELHERETYCPSKVVMCGSVIDLHIVYDDSKARIWRNFDSLFFTKSLDYTRK